MVVGGARFYFSFCSCCWFETLCVVNGFCCPMTVRCCYIFNSSSSSSRIKEIIIIVIIFCCRTNSVFLKPILSMEHFSFKWLRFFIFFIFVVYAACEWEFMKIEDMHRQRKNKSKQKRMFCRCVYWSAIDGFHTIIYRNICIHIFYVILFGQTTKQQAVDSHCIFIFVFMCIRRSAEVSLLYCCLFVFAIFVVVKNSKNDSEMQ